MGSERNVGADRVAQLCGVAAYAPDDGPARSCRGLVGGGRLAGDHVCVPGREHVPVGPALIWNLVTQNESLYFDNSKHLAYIIFRGR